MKKSGQKGSFEEKLRAYSKAAAGALMVAPVAVGMTALMPERAEAAIHYSGVKNVHLSPGSKYKVNMDTDTNAFGSSDEFYFTLHKTSQQYTKYYATGSSLTSTQRRGRFLLAVNNPYGSHLGEPPLNSIIDEGKNLPAGYQIGPSATHWYGKFHTANSKYYPYFAKLAGMATKTSFTHTTGSSMTPTNTKTFTYGNFIGTTGFLGVRFDTGTVAPCYHYGWIRVSVNTDVTEAIIHDWAYEDQCNTPIRAGDTGQVTTVPALNQWGAFALVALLAAGGAVTLRRTEEKA